MWAPAEEFAALLRAREAWRDTHEKPLSALPMRERYAQQFLQHPEALIQPEGRAPIRHVMQRHRRQLEDGITDPRPGAQ